MKQVEKHSFPEFEYLNVIGNIFEGYTIDRTVKASENGLKNFEDFNTILKYANKNGDYSIFDYYKDIRMLVEDNRQEEIDGEYNLLVASSISKPNISEEILTSVVDKFSTLFYCVCNEFKHHDQNLNYSNFGAFARASSSYGETIFSIGNGQKFFNGLKKEDMNFATFCLSSATEGMYYLERFVENNFDNLIQNSNNFESLIENAQNFESISTLDSVEE